MKKTLARWAPLLALLACSAAASAAEISDGSLRKLLEVSGMARDIGAFPVLVTASVEAAEKQAEAQNNATLTREDFDALKQAMGDAFQAGPIIDATAAAVKKNVSEADAKQLIAWYESDLARKIARAETAATGPAARDDLVKQAPALLANKQRMGYARTLDKLLHTTDETMEFQARNVVALYSALSARVHPDHPVDAATYSRQVNAALERARPRFEQATALGFAYTYRNLDMASLKRYQKFLERPSTRRFHDSARAGMMEGVDHAVVKVANDIAAMRPPQAGQDAASGAAHPPSR